MINIFTLEETDNCNEIIVTDSNRVYSNVLIDASNNEFIQYSIGTRIKELDFKGVKLNSFNIKFNEFTNLKSVNLPSGHYSDCSNLFAKCTSLWYVNGDEFEADNCNDMFKDCTSLRSVNVPLLNPVNAEYMFCYCAKLKEVNIKCTRLEKCEFMFHLCYSIQSIDIDWNTSKVTSMYNMFGNCYKLVHLNCDNWDMTNVESIECIFSFCFELIANIDNWKFKQLVNANYAFFKCNMIEHVDLSNSGISDNCTKRMMFYNCKRLLSVKGITFKDSDKALSYCFNLLK